MNVLHFVLGVVVVLVLEDGYDALDEVCGQAFLHGIRRVEKVVWMKVNLLFIIV